MSDEERTDIQKIYDNFFELEDELKSQEQNNESTARDAAENVAKFINTETQQAKRDEAVANYVKYKQAAEAYKKASQMVRDKIILCKNNIKLS